MIKIINKCLFGIFIIYLSCKSSHFPIDRIQRDLDLPKSDSVVKDIPERFKENSFYLRLFQKQVRSLGLKTLEKGKTGLQIRLWQDDYNNSGILYVFDFSNNKWAGQKCIYKFRPKEEGEWLDSLSGSFVQLNAPNGGWDHFINKLLDKRIHLIKDYTNIPGYFSAADTKTILVEISTDNFYKCYELPLIDKQPKSIVEAKEMKDILQLINNEFRK